MTLAGHSSSFFPSHPTFSPYHQQWFTTPLCDSHLQTYRPVPPILPNDGMMSFWILPMIAGVQGSYCHFSLHTPVNYCFEYLFICLSTMRASSFWSACSYLLPNFLMGFFHFYTGTKSVVYPGQNSSVQLIHWKYFPHSVSIYCKYFPQSILIA